MKSPGPMNNGRLLLKNKKALNEMEVSPRRLYPTRLSSRCEGLIHKFMDKQQLQNFIDSKPILSLL